MSPSFRIRAVGDSPSQQALLAWLQLEALPYDTPADTTRGHWWVAYEGDHPAGFAGLYESSSDVGTGYLCRAGVLPAFRGRGLQRKLIATRERKAKSLGLTALCTDTIPGNPASSNNLIACGFRMYTPAYDWAGPDACYWRKTLKHPP